MWVTLVGDSGANAWSNPAAWSSGASPSGAGDLNIRLAARSTADLGTAQDPFQANDIAGGGSGNPYPRLTLSGIVTAGDVSDLADLRVLSSGRLTIRHDLANVGTLSVSNAGTVSVGNDLSHVEAVAISYGSRMQVGQSVGTTAFTIGIGGGTLMLDNPPPHAFVNPLTLGAGVANITIELGHVRFDAARFVPNQHGGLSGQINLLDQGKVAYVLTHVTERGKAGALSVRVDKATGHDVLSYRG